MSDNDVSFSRLTSVVNRPEWDVFMVWAMQEKTKCHDRLEVCKPEDLKTVQGEVNIWKSLLTLRDNVNKYMSRGTKTQF
jgi:hypothetical protein